MKRIQNSQRSPSRRDATTPLLQFRLRVPHLRILGSIICRVPQVVWYPHYGTVLERAVNGGYEADYAW